CVRDEGEEAQIRLQGSRKRLGRLAPLLPIRVFQKVQGWLERQFLAVNSKAQARHRLVEEAIPCPAPGDGGFVKKLLDAILKLMGPVLAHVEHPGPVAAEERVVLQGLVDQRVVDLVQFQREEEDR